MKKSTKAALLSALVFPGIGHLYLKQWVVGLLLLIVAVVATGYIGTVVMGTASVIVEKIQSGAVPPDIDTITALVQQQTSGIEQSIDTAKIIWLICWVVGIAGSYWQGRAQDKAVDVAL